jgi:hypothetical protein
VPIPEERPDAVTSRFEAKVIGGWQPVYKVIHLIVSGLKSVSIFSAINNNPEYIIGTSTNDVRESMKLANSVSIEINCAYFMLNRPCNIPALARPAHSS